MTNYRQTTKHWLFATGLTVSLAFTGCHSNSAPAPITNTADTSNATPDGQDPALANVPTSNNGTQVLGQSASYAPQQQAESYAPGQQAAAPIVRGESQTYAPQQDNQSYDYQNPPDTGDQQPVYANQAPPPLPEYDQPPAPDPNYLWTPGYWAYGAGGYYWVPGAWAQAPYYGALWTPPYWGYYGHRYRYYHGYWGPHVGYYGGVNYGFGYIGVGFFGGYWHGHDFFYNREVTHVDNVHITNVYNRTVVYNNVHYGMQPNNRVSYNGGNGGINSRPRPFEIAAMRERHEGPTAVQQENHSAAMNNRAQFYSDNHGRPAVAVAARPLSAPGGVRPTPTGIQPGRPGFNGRPIEANQPGAQNGRPNEPNRPGMQQQPGIPPNRSGEMNRPVQQSGAHPVTQPAQQPNRPGAQPGRPEAGRTPEMNRPNQQPAQQQQVRPATPAPVQRPTSGMNNPGAHPAPNRPAPEARPTPQPQQQERTQPQQARPQPQQARPQPQQARPQPAAAPRPAPAAHPQPAARPAPPAQHEGAHPGGNEHR